MQIKFDRWAGEGGGGGVINEAEGKSKQTILC